MFSPRVQGLRRLLFTYIDYDWRYLFQQLFKVDDSDFPVDVRSSGMNAFSRCSELKTVDCCGDGDVSFSNAFDGLAESSTLYKAMGTPNFDDGALESRRQCPRIN